MMFLVLKIFSFLSFILFSNKIITAVYAHDIEEKRHASGTYRLEEAFSKKIETDEIEARISPLIKLGFSEKRAKELFAQCLTDEIFSSKLKNGEMVNLNQLTHNALGSSFKMEIYKSPMGIVDNVYIQRTIDFLTFHQESNRTIREGYLKKYREACIVYNEVHYLEAEEELSPLLVNFETLKQRHPYTYSISWLKLAANLTINRSCGKVSLNNVPLSWIGSLKSIFDIVKQRFSSTPPNQTISILRPCGLFTLYNVRLL